MESLPIKMFEYMAAGIPFIASDFPLWKSIAQETQAGFCVDINDINAIKNAILRILNDRTLAQEMGLKGRKAVEKHYNWLKEQIKLEKLYRMIEG